MSVLLTGAGPTFSSSATGPVTPGTTSSTSTSAGTTSTSTSTVSSTTTPDPNLPIQSNLQAWWDSRESASYPGSGSTWYDLTANANDLTLTNNSGADPVFVPGPDYFATGSKGYFQRTSGFTNLPSGNSHFTVSVCCRKTGAWEDASTYQLGQTSDKLGHSGFHRAGTTGNTQSTAFYSYTNNGYMSNPFDWVVLSYVYDGANFLLIEDTTQLASVSANAFNVNVAGGTLLIGWTNGFTNYEFKGDVLGALIYDKALDNTELQHNYDYFLNPMPPTTSSSSSSTSSSSSSSTTDTSSSSSSSTTDTSSSSSSSTTDTSSSTSTTTSTTTTPFVPTNITNLVNWYDGSDVTTMFKDTAGTQAVTADNDLVARWDDKSGQGNIALQATSGSRPTYKTNIRNSNSVLSYDGGDFLLAGAFAATMGMENTTFVVLKQASTGVGMSYVDFRKDNTSNQNDLWLVGGDVIFAIGYEIIARDNAGTLDKLGLNTVDTNWHYLTASYDLTELRLQDGTNTPSTLTKAYGSTQLNYARIGGTYAAGSNLNGYLAEVLVYSRKLSASEIGQVQTYLAAKWGF